LFQIELRSLRSSYSIKCAQDTESQGFPEGLESSTMASPPLASEVFFRRSATVKHPLRILITCALSTILTVTAVAACSPPSQPGAVICYPTANATTVPIFNIEGAATGKNLPITKMILYADNQKIYESDNNSSFVYADYQAWQLGTHHLVLNAWDSDGNLFQASTTISVPISINTTYNTSCSHPNTGVHLCLPISNTWYPQTFGPFFASGSAAVVAMKGYINNANVVSTTGNSFGIGYGTNPDPSGFKFVANGWDSKGDVWSASATGIHLYYDGGCIKACNPGIAIQDPPILTDQTSPFSLNATVQNNPAQITEMKAYLDNSLAATSAGPTILANISASHGTHLLTVQAWDTSGNLYKSQVTVNVQ